MENSNEILNQVLALDVKFQKTIVEMACHYHKNPAPDFVFLENKLEAERKLLAEWNELKLHYLTVKEKDPLAVVYFSTVNMDGNIPALINAIDKVKARIAAGEIPEYKGPGLKMLEYVIDNFHNAATKTLAKSLGFSLD